MVFQVAGTPIGMRSIVIALIASVGGFLFGYDTGQISGIQEMDSFKEAFATETGPNGEPAFNSWYLGIIVAFLSVGTFFGVLAGAPIADRFGRRLAMVADVVVFCIGVIIQVTAFDAWLQVAWGRLISGIGVGALSAAVPLYQSESLPSQMRGTLVATYQLFITFGIVVANAINIGTRDINSSASWRVPIVLGIPFSLVLGIGIMFCPESPRWLAAQGRYDEAYNAVALVRGCKRSDANPFVEQDYSGIISHVERDAKLEKSTWADCFRPANMTLHRTLLGMLLQALQQLTGANYFFYFSATIFRSVGLEDSFVTSLILSLVNFVSTFGGLYILQRFGRRLPLIYGAGGMVVWLLVFTLAGSLGEPETNKGIGQLMIVGACFFIVFYATTWAPGIWLWIGENFDTRTRAKQASLAAASNWFFNFLLAFFTAPITDSISFNYGFIFVGANTVGMFVAYFFVRETKDLTLEHINDMYMDKSCKPWNSRSWVPAGYTSRNELKQKSSNDDVLNVEDPKGGAWSSEDPARKHSEVPIQKTEDA